MISSSRIEPKRKNPYSLEMAQTREFFAKESSKGTLISPEEFHEIRINGYMRFLINEVVRFSPSFVLLDYMTLSVGYECNMASLPEFHLYFEELADICNKHGWSLSYKKSWRSRKSYVRLVSLNQIDKYPPFFYHHTNLLQPICTWFKSCCRQ